MQNIKIALNLCQMGRIWLLQREHSKWLSLIFLNLSEFCTFLDCTMLLWVTKLYIGLGDLY